MRPSEYENLAAHECTYWWFVGKRRLAKFYLEQYGPDPLPAACILDAGCGPGANLAQFRALTPCALGIDFSSYALNYAKQKYNLHLSQANILKLPLADNSVDLITILDVLYHQWIPDDEAALAETYRVLKTGGTLILTDPAFSFLSGPHDKANLAARRNTVPQMGAKLTGLGFEIKKQSYVYALLFPIAFLRRWLQRTFAKNKPPASDLRSLPSPLNAVLLALFSIELAWLKVASLPWGTSIFFVAQKPK